MLVLIFNGYIHIQMVPIGTHITDMIISNLKIRHVGIFQINMLIYYYKYIYRNTNLKCISKINTYTQWHAKFFSVVDM